MIKINFQKTLTHCQIFETLLGFECRHEEQETDTYSAIWYSEKYNRSKLEKNRGTVRLTICDTIADLLDGFESDDYYKLMGEFLEHDGLDKKSIEE